MDKTSWGTGPKITFFYFGAALAFFLGILHLQMKQKIYSALEFLIIAYFYFSFQRISFPLFMFAKLLRYLFHNILVGAFLLPSQKKAA